MTNLSVRWKSVILSVFLILATFFADAAPRVIIISLDGATPRLVEQYLNTNEGLNMLESVGIRAEQNFTITPSLTAPGHIAIATGSNASSNDINANSFHLVASPFTVNISGFGAPIGGYLIDGPAETPNPTAEPLWIQLLANGKSVVTATWPGGDGVDVRVPGAANNAIVQPASERTVNYTVPFGAFGGVGAQGFSLTASDFGLAPAETVSQLGAAGHVSFSPVLQKTSILESFAVGGVTYNIQVAALDATNDSIANYDTLAFFDTTIGIQPGPFNLPSTGPAYVKASEAVSSRFYLEGSSTKAGVGFYISRLEPDLSIVRIARYSANFIPRNTPVVADVDDINENVGFWAPQPDFRIPERLTPSFASFPDVELEAVYEDLVRTFTDYQTRLALRAIERNPDADFMIYFEQPDGSAHQFLLNDPRQPTDIKNPNSIGSGQDPAKVARYSDYVGIAYAAANSAVQKIIDAVGTRPDGKPNSNIIVTSDHGFEIFHTAVSMNNLLIANGIDLAKVRAVTSGPAVNVYINLIGREPNGTVTPSEFVILQQQVLDILEAYSDMNQTYTLGLPSVPVFDKIYARPLPPDLNDPNFGRGTSEFIGQDSGDVFAMLIPGYNFDGTQNPVVIRSGDPQSPSPILSLPNFYGAHGYDPELSNLSSIFYAAGPDIRYGTLTRVRNIDIAPTIHAVLRVPSSGSVDGKRLPITIPRKIKMRTLGEMFDLLPGEDFGDTLRILKAIFHTARSLTTSKWHDDSHLKMSGSFVFNEERKAVRELGFVDDDPSEVLEVIQNLTDVDAQLALIALDEAIAANGNEDDVEDSQAEIALAEQDEAAGEYDDAIQHYKKAWVFAQKAVKNIPED